VLAGGVHGAHVLGDNQSRRRQPSTMDLLLRHGQLDD